MKLRAAVERLETLVMRALAAAANALAQVAAVAPITFTFNGLPANTVETTMGSLILTAQRTIFFRVTYLIRDTVSGKGMVAVQRVSIQGDPANIVIIGSTSEFQQNNMTSAGVVNVRVIGQQINFNFTNNAVNVDAVNVVVSIAETLGPTS